MKKINHKGFMLVEVLVVSVFISSILIVMFVQFKKINNSYNVSFSYNTVDSLYLLNNVKKRLITNITNISYNYYKEQISNNINNKKYINIYDNICSTSGYDCELLKSANIKELYFARYDAKESMLNDESLSIKFRNYINYMNFEIKNSTSDSEYFIIAKFENETYASINF